MDVSELLRTLETMLPSASGRISFVVTDLSDRHEGLERLLDGALAAARRHGVPLAEVQLDMDRYPDMGAFYWHVPVTDSGRKGIVRLIFESRGAAAALATVPAGPRAAAEPARA